MCNEISNTSDYFQPADITHDSIKDIFNMLFIKCKTDRTGDISANDVTNMEKDLTSLVLCVYITVP